MDKAFRKEISEKIERGEDVSFSFKFLDPKRLMLINSVMAKHLGKMDHIFLLNSIVTIIREVVVNAMKANAKRVFFYKNNLDIRKNDDYKKGMDRFKNEVIGEFELIESDLNNSDYYIHMSFALAGKDLDIKIVNNSPILPEELERINHRIAQAKKYNDFSEAYEEIQDDSEGAGLGIVLTILFLKNMGINPDSFKLASNGKITQTVLKIPRELRPSTLTKSIRDEIVNDVEGIPTFPENILELMRLCNDQEASIEMISGKIETDPALASDVIKLSNSAGFVPGKRIDSVSEAVKTIGLKNVNAILMASNARRILDKRYANFEEIWTHCNRTAFYARHIASILKKQKFSEKVFMAGLLHDLGKIVLLATRIELVEKIAETVKNRKMRSSTMMEEISIGISHSEIGELISKKWNFPEYLVEAIRYHHAPLSSSQEHRSLVEIVYLANMMVGVSDRRYYYYYCDEGVLERFGINNEKDFIALKDKLNEKWEKATLE